MKMVRTRGVNLATQSFGSPGDPAILLVMGATASMLGWPEALCTGLADRGLYVIRFDHRDTGRSTTVQPGEASYSVEDLAQDVIGILDSYSLQQSTLMGMSLGGYIAQIVALTHPQRVRSMVLMGSEPLGWDGPELPLISPALLGHFGDLPKLDWSNTEMVVDFLLTIERLCQGTGRTLDEAGVRAHIEVVVERAVNPASMFNHATLSTREDWTGRYREIASPTLVIHGEDDPVLPLENGRAIAAGIAGAELKLLPGIGHELPPAILPEIVDRVATHVRQHL